MISSNNSSSGTGVTINLDGFIVVVDCSLSLLLLSLLSLMKKLLVAVAAAIAVVVVAAAEHVFVVLIVGNDIVEPSLRAIVAVMYNNCSALFAIVVAVLNLLLSSSDMEMDSFVLHPYASYGLNNAAAADVVVVAAADVGVVVDVIVEVIVVIIVVGVEWAMIDDLNDVSNTVKKIKQN